MDDPFEIELAKEVRVHFGALGDNKQVPTEVSEAGDLVGTTVMNPMESLQEMGDTSRLSTGISS